MAKKIITFVLTIAAGIAGIVLYVMGCINNIAFFPYLGIFALWTVAALFGAPAIETDKTRTIVTMIIATAIYTAGLIGFILACIQQLGFWASAGRFIIWFIASYFCSLIIPNDKYTSLSEADDAYNKQGHVRRAAVWTQEKSASGRVYDVRTETYVKDEQHSAGFFAGIMFWFGTVAFPVLLVIAIVKMIRNN